VQEAYDVLSDPKKREMYDQVGFYSESASQAPAREVREAVVHSPGWISTASIFRMLSPARRAARGRRTDAAGGGFRDVFSQFFGGRGGAHPANRNRKRARSRIP